MSMKVIPMFGHGLGRTINSSRNRTGDMFSGPSEEEFKERMRIRFAAVQDFLSGKRADPDVTAYELNFHSELGGDAFDRSLSSFRGA